MFVCGIASVILMFSEKQVELVWTVSAVPLLPWLIYHLNLPSFWTNQLQRFLYIWPKALMSPYPNVHLYPQDTMSNFASPPRPDLETKQGSCFPPACLCSPSQQRSMGTPKTGWERDTPALHTGDGSLGKQTPAYQFAQRCRQKPRADKHWLWMKKDTRKKAENEDRPDK